MEHVEIGKVYRHFKGNYYFVENLGLFSEDKEPMVIYKPLYDSCSDIWVRPEKMFLEEISKDRSDNITGQTHRFELVDKLNENYLQK